MLHKINLPRSWKYLKWILALQHRLLIKLCDPNMTPEQVSIEWVKTAFPKLPPEWVTSFCNRSFEKKSLLARMQIIASFDDVIKAKLLADFEHDVDFRRAFDVKQQQFRFYCLQVIEDDTQKKDVRAFFESFYSVQFYFASDNSRSGYYIPNHKGECVRFHHFQFLTDFDEAQEIRVCSFCDGALSGKQVDHFYPKNRHPFLSCHPFNLVPICGECNKGKLGKEPMDSVQDNENALMHWPHPYLRSLANIFIIELVREGEPLRPKLVGKDESTDIRLSHLEELIGLQDRWLKALKNKFSYTQELIDNHRRYLQRRGLNSDISRDALVAKLSEWAEELPAVGKEPHHLLWDTFLKQAAGANPDIFIELETHSREPLPTLT